MASRKAGNNRPVTFVQVPDVKDPAMQRAFDTLTKAVQDLQARLQVGGTLVVPGSGDPEGKVAAPIGTLYLRRDGDTGTTLYVKEDDDNGTTGWVGK